MSIGILDLPYGNTFKPGLTPTSLPISSTSFLSGVTVSGNNFSFSTTGNYQVELFIDTDFSGSDGSRITVDVFNVTQNRSEGNFQIGSHSGESSWMIPLTVSSASDQFTVRAVTFSSQPGTINAARIVPTNLDGAASEAPANATYVLVSANASLTQARIITAGSNITLTDNGAGNTLVIAAAGSVTGVTATAPITSSGGAAPVIALSNAVAPGTADAASAVIWQPNANLKNLSLQTRAAQTANVFEVQATDTTDYFTVPAVPAMTGAGNLLAGAGAGAALTTGVSTTCLGTSAGTLNTASQNTFIGAGAGAANVAGIQQCIIGFNAGALVTGNSNTLVGHQCGEGITTGNQNVMIGHDAGSDAAGTTQTDCVFVGYHSGLSNTANENVFVGRAAGRLNTSGTGQCFVGFQAGATVTGSNNTIFGHQAGDSFTTGARNCLFGKDAGGAAGATAMSDTAIFGYSAGVVNTANENTFIGSSSGSANTSGTGQCFIGYQSGLLVTGNDNTIIGHQAGDSFTTGARNCLVGKSAGGAAGATSMSDTVFVGYQSGLVNTANQNTFVGSASGQANTSGTGQCFAGYQSGTLVTGNDNTIFGHQAGDSFTTGARNTLMGKDAGGAAGATSMSDTVFVGYQAGLLNTANQNTYVGSGAGASNTSSEEQVFVGYQAGNLATGGGNTLVGYRSGYRLTSGINNTLLGDNTGAASAAFANNTFIGVAAGNVNTANQNTFIGSGSGQSNTSGTGQLFVGYNSGNLATGNNNTLLGNTAGNTLTSGADNVLIGFNAQVSTNSFSQSIGIGSGCSVTASNQFVAGASGAPATDVYFGKGVTNATPTAYTVNGTGASGTDTAGAALQLAGGKGTGTAEPGLVVLKYPLKTSTGTTLQGLSAQSYPVGGVLFTGNSAAVTVSANVVNTTETTLIGTIVGSQSLEGGLLRVGRQIRVTLMGVMDTSAVPVTFRMRIKKGSLALWDSGAVTPTANLTNSRVSCSMLLNTRAIGSSGVILAEGFWQYIISASATNSVQGAGGATVNTTTTENMDVTIQFGGNTAGNSIAINNVMFEILN